jgi:hypothetical protein
MEITTSAESASQTSRSGTVPRMIMPTDVVEPHLQRLLNAYSIAGALLQPQQ